MNKKNLLFVLTFAVVAMVGLCFASCSKDDGGDNNEKTENLSNQDPEGTVVLNMMKNDETDKPTNRYSIAIGTIYMDVANNLVGYGTEEFVTVGKVNGLGKITQIPVSGWATKVALVPGTGYVMRVKNPVKKSYDYARIYVVDYIGQTYNDDFGNTSSGITGVTIKYQAPFEGVDEEISLDEYSLTFNAQGGSQAVIFNNKNVVVFSAVSSELWCQVNKTSNLSDPYISNGVTITVSPSDSQDARTATVTLTTASDRKTTLVVTQDGVKPYIAISQEEIQVNGSARQGFGLGVATNCNLDDISITGTTDWCQAELVDYTYRMHAKARKANVSESNQSARSYALVMSVTANGSKNERSTTLKLTSKDNRATTTLTVKQEGSMVLLTRQEIEVSAKGGQHDVAFTTTLDNADLVVTCDSTWCRPTIYAYNENNSYVNIILDANESSRERKTNIKIKTLSGSLLATIKLTQVGDKIKFSNYSSEVGAVSSTNEYDFYCNASSGIVAKSNVSWCKPSIIYPSSSSNSRKLVLSFTDNTKAKDRTAKITLTHKNYADTTVFTLTQKGMTISMVGTVWFDRKAGNQTVTIETQISDISLLTPKSSDESWCTLSTNGNKLTIRVSAATTDREANISFTGFTNKIKVVQSKYAVGDEYNEGKITGIVGRMDNEQRFVVNEVGAYCWSTEYVETGANNKDDGQANMAIIKKIPGWEDLYPAFAACDSLNKDGVTGWYLPAINELIHLSVGPQNWWSSTENDVSTSYNKNNYNRVYWDSKQSGRNVIAVHKF